MFPMKRVFSTVTAADMAVFFMTANSAARRISGGNNITRVLPESGGDQNARESPKGSENGAARLSLEEVEGFPLPEYKYRLSSCRSRKPMLETINEEPVRSR
jgi:hypothetical protein